MQGYITKSVLTSSSFNCFFVVLRPKGDNSAHMKTSPFSVKGLRNVDTCTAYRSFDHRENSLLYHNCYDTGPHPKTSTINRLLRKARDNEYRSRAETIGYMLT